MTRRISILTLLAFLFVAGCVASATLLWKIDSDSALSQQHHLVMAEDAQSLYAFASSPNTPLLVVEHYDLAGQLLQEYRFDIAWRSDPNRPPLRIGEHSFYLPAATATGSLLLDLDHGVRWQGFNGDAQGADMDALEIHEIHLNRQDDLVFSGMLTEPGPAQNSVRVAVIGRVDQNGQLRTFRRYDTASTPLLLAGHDSNSFIAVIHYPFSEDNDLRSLITQLDNELNPLQEFPLAEYLDYANAVNNGVIGSIGWGEDKRSVALSLTDGTLQTTTIPTGSWTRQVVTDHSIYTISGDDDSRRLYNPLTVCRFNMEYQRQWCRTTQFKTSSYTALAVAVNQQDDLALSLDSGGEFAVNLHGVIEPVPNGVAGKLGLVGEERNDIVHEVFSSSGERLYLAEEDPFVARGEYRVCYSILVCLHPNQWEAGVFATGQILLLEDRRLLALNQMRFDGDISVARRISLWQR